MIALGVNRMKRILQFGAIGRKFLDNIFISKEVILKVYEDLLNNGLFWICLINIVLDQNPKIARNTSFFYLLLNFETFLHVEQN